MVNINDYHDNRLFLKNYFLIIIIIFSLCSMNVNKYK